MVRIAVLGNCQSTEIADIIENMLPDASLTVSQSHLYDQLSPEKIKPYIIEKI